MKLFSKTSKPEGLDAERLKQSTRTDRRVDQALSRDEAAEQADRLHELAVLSLFLHSAGTLEEMLSLFLERAPRVTGAVVSYPLLLDKRREVLTASQLASVDDPGLEQASIAANENMADLEFPMPVRSYLRDIMDSGEVTVTSNLFEVLGSALTKEACDQLRQGLNITKAAVVPLVMEGESFGLSVFLFSEREPDVEVLELAAGHCTLALKALLAGEETTRFGGIDPVTWAHSRGFFMESLEGEVVRARRFGRGLSIIFLDLDDFGEFNESFGHTMGDRVLRSVGMTLASAIALPEMVARYGGDEFAILLPESHRAMAVELTTELVDKLDTLSVFETDQDGKTGVSASFAIVSYPEDGASREELLAAAEMSLEQSKEERRAMRMPKRQLTPVQQLRMSGRRRIA
ncbi:MAG TPA: GGDEF domain-containing protein [Dehalococcoidia bacterium]|nr:GGDEF domain-containing protein [Dehalococcoidia bacterium]